jgi:hypothetical protein
MPGVTLLQTNSLDGGSIVRKSKGRYFTVEYENGVYNINGKLIDNKIHVGNKPTFGELIRDIIENSDKYPNANGKIIVMGVG